MTNDYREEKTIGWSRYLTGTFQKKKEKVEATTEQIVGENNTKEKRPDIRMYWEVILRVMLYKSLLDKREAGISTKETDNPTLADSSTVNVHLEVNREISVSFFKDRMIIMSECGPHPHNPRTWENGGEVG